MLYDLRITARGGGGTRELAGRLSKDVGGGVFQTEVGPSGEAVIIWPRDAADAAKGESRARLDADPFGKHTLEILELAPFMQPLQPQELGRVWELRWFDYPADSGPQALSAFEKALPNREKYYPVVGCWTVKVGPNPDRIYVLSPFKDWDHRDELMAQLRGDPSWPPLAEPACIFSGARLLLPAAFSPLH